MKRFAYASCTLFGRERTGVLFRAADDYPAEPALIAEIEARFGIEGAQVLRYDDRRRGKARHIRVADNKLEAVSLSGDIAAESWLREYLDGEQPVAALGRLLLSPSATAPKGFKARGRIICNCYNVAESEISAALAAGAPAAPEQALCALQEKLKCGTNCGSCVPELKKIIAHESMAGAVAA
jgi:assimilatory nitrate reductase catalytic subunit